MIKKQSKKFRKMFIVADLVSLNLHVQLSIHENQCIYKDNKNNPKFDKNTFLINRVIFVNTVRNLRPTDRIYFAMS